MTDSAHADDSRVSEDTAADRILWTDGLVLLLHIVLPIAITGIILGRKTIFSKLQTHLDTSYLSVFCPSFSKREKLKKWMSEYLPYADGGLAAIWKDGSLMCTLINSVVPGACPNPHRHWKKPPMHGQALAYKYLGVIPVFSESDFDAIQPSATMEKLLIDYMSNLQTAIDKLQPNEEMTFSNRYIARGMGLVTGEQHRRTIIYIYPNCKGQMNDLLVNIRGPYNTYGSVTLEGREFAKEYNSKTPDKRQKSFLKSLSTDFSNLLKPKEKGPACDIPMKTVFEKDRAKLVFIPNNSGVYEICLTTNGEHIAGSPYNLTIEKNRSGISDDLNEDQTDSKIGKRSVLNTVIYYEKLKKSSAELQKTGECKDGDEDQCKIDLIRSSQATKEHADAETHKQVDSKICKKEKQILQSLTQRINSPILIDEIKTDKNSNTIEENSSESKSPVYETVEKNMAKGGREILENLQNKKRENFGLNIIDTLRDIPVLKKFESSPLENVDGKETREIFQNELQLDFKDQTESKRLKFASNKSTPDEHTQSQNQRGPGPVNIFQSLPSSSCEHINNSSATKTDSSSCLEDSGTYVNEEIAPDSLTSSVETHGSSEEISFSTGSDNNSLNEVNNNDIMVKSNEDICYLILNQSDQHKRVYSKDFISCKDDKSKDDLSKSDPNLHIEETKNSSNNVSALSQDNVQEAHNTSLHHHHQTSRIVKNHPQEGHIAGTRSHSYSYNSLIDRKRHNNEGLEFKQHFLMRKAFWTNISMSNMNLATSVNSSSSKIHETAHGKKCLHNHSNVLMRTESVINDETYKSRSLDYVRVRQRKKIKCGYESTICRNEYGSVDDLKFLSVRNRRENYLREQESKHSSNKHHPTPELYAVRGDKCSWSIHEKIKCFEPIHQQSSIEKEKGENLKTVPENLTVKTKIKERFEKAQTYFKELENQSIRTDGHHKRRYSLDDDSNTVLSQRFASLRYVSSRFEVNANDSEAKSSEYNDLTKNNIFSHATGVKRVRQPIYSLVNCNDTELQLQLFLNERKKRKQLRTPAIDVFN